MKNKTIRDFANYALGDLFVKGFLFISLPLLSRILSPEQYGKLSIINTAIMILYVFISLNLQNAVTNRYMLTKEKFNDYFKTILCFLFPFQLLLLCFSPFISITVSRLLGIDSKDFYWVMIICMMLSYLYIYTCYLQASRQSSAYVKINVVSKISEIILIFIFAYLMTHQQYMSKIYAQIIVTSIILVFLLRPFSRLTNGTFNYSYLKEALIFSVPLIVHVLSNSLLSQVDRIIINDMLGPSAAGIYSFSYNLGAGILVLIMAWNSSWQPRLYKYIDEDNVEKIRAITKASTIIIFIASGLAIVFSKEIILLIADESYYSGVNILPAIIIGNSVIHLYLTYVNFIFYKKRSFLISSATLLAVIINIGLNYLLIPKYGIAGSAWATVISYILLAIFHYITSTFISRNNSISYRYIVYFLSGLLSLYALTLYVESELSFVLTVVVKIFAALLMASVIIKLKIYKELSE